MLRRPMRPSVLIHQQQRYEPTPEAQSLASGRVLPQMAIEAEFNDAIAFFQDGNKVKVGALQLLLDLVLGLAGVLLRNIGTNVELACDPLPGPLHCLAELGKRCAGWTACSVAEVGRMLTGERSQLIDVRPLRDRLHSTVSKR